MFKIVLFIIGFFCFQFSASAFQAINDGFENGLQNWRVFGSVIAVGEVQGVVPPEGVKQAQMASAQPIAGVENITGGSTICTHDLFQNATAFTLMQIPVDGSSTVSLRYRLLSHDMGAPTGNPLMFVLWASNTTSHCKYSMLARRPDNWQGLYATNYEVAGPFIAGDGTPEAGTLSIGVAETGHAVGGQALWDDVRVAPLFSRKGVCSQIASGGGWRTRFTVANFEAFPTQVQVNFWGDDGQALALPLTFPQAGRGGAQFASSVTRTLAPGESFVFESEGDSAAPPAVGWADILANGTVGTFATFRNQSPGQADMETTSPLDSTIRPFQQIPFDNTSPYTAAVALVNGSSTLSNSILATVLDENGVILLNRAPVGTLAAGGHMAFVVRDLLAVTANLRGTIRFESASGVPINALALQFGANRTFTSIPIL